MPVFSPGNRRSQAVQFAGPRPDRETAPEGLEDGGSRGDGGAVDRGSRGFGPWICWLISEWGSCHIHGGYIFMGMIFMGIMYDNVIQWR